MANVTAATAAEAGIVSTHAITMLIATPQRTADNRLVDPTPMMPPAIVCVVLTGMPTCVANKIAAADEASAAKPSLGSSLVIRRPIVRTMRHPPASVHAAIAACAERITQMGTWDSPA